jgi:hypothetical protein
MTKTKISEEMISEESKDQTSTNIHNNTQNRHKVTFRRKDQDYNSKTSTLETRRSIRGNTQVKSLALHNIGDK